LTVQNTRSRCNSYACNRYTALGVAKFWIIGNIADYGNTYFAGHDYSAAASTDADSAVASVLASGRFE
jgi:hypothetical protein